MEQMNSSILKLMGITQEIFNEVEEMGILRFNGIAILKELLQGPQEASELNPFTSIDLGTSSEKDINAAFVALECLFKQSGIFRFYIPNFELHTNVIKTWLATMKIVRDTYAYNGMEAVVDETLKLSVEAAHTNETESAKVAADNFIEQCIALQAKYNDMKPKPGEIIINREYVSSLS